MSHIDRMTHETRGTGRDLVFVMGWGNRLDGENERWFIDRLADDYTVHAFEIPTNGTDFEADYLRPVREHTRGLTDPLYLSHSTGGLVVGHLAPVRAVYISPWWAFYGAKLRGPVFEYGTRLPIERPFVPIDFEQEEVGSRVSDEAWAQLPKQVSPAFIRTIREAQETMPEPGDEAIVCCTLRETLVGLQGIGERVTPEQIRLYDGTHEPFSSADREAACSVVDDALREVA